MFKCYICDAVIKFIVGPLYPRYYLGFFANSAGSNDTNVSILLITSETHQVEYSIEAPGIGLHHNGTLTAGAEVVLNLSIGVQVSSHHDQDKGIYLTTSSRNVTVIGQCLRRASSDSFYVLPTMELDDAYVYYGISVPRAIIHSSPINSSILIVGIENNTIMRLTVTQYVTIGVGDTIVRLIPGIQYSYVINRLQTIFIGSLEDLSGTKIATDRPVSVFSGHQCANVPSNVTYCSYLIEQMPPTAMWGKVYYVAPLVNKISYTIKILAAYPSTNVNMYCNNVMESFTLNEGEFVSKVPMNDYCAIYSNKVVLVVQFAHGGSEDLHDYGDPMMTLVPATNDYLNKFDFSTIRNPLRAGYNHHVNLIVMEQYYQPNLIQVVAGGVERSLDIQQWVPILVNNFAEAYVTQLRIPEGITQITHTDAAAQMMAIVYGFTTSDGYGHIGGIRSNNGRNQTFTPEGY